MSSFIRSALSGVFALAVITGHASAAPMQSSAANMTKTDQVPFKFPLDNGFPNIKLGSDAFKQIQWEAHGTLPNTPLPTTISDGTAGILQVIAFGEIFEVALFQSLVNNITNNVPGYAIGESTAGRNMILETLKAVVAQEELHYIGANAILASAGRATIEPCSYVFPSTNFDDAITFASTVGDLVLGILQEVAHDFAANGDGELVPLITSVIGQEGEQNGFYRFSRGRVPSSLPFLTAGSGSFGLSSILQNIAVPGSCPSLGLIKAPVFEPLTILSTPISECTSEVWFSIKSKLTKTDDLRLVYINQQNAPVVNTLNNVTINDGTITFSAPFEFYKFTLNGLTIAAVTKSAGPFTNATEVAAHTSFGPGLIEIN